MITRGIKYYNISDIQKELYLTMEAKQLQIKLSDPENTTNFFDFPVIERKTHQLSFFIGDHVIVFIPKKAVEQILMLEDFENLMKNPLARTEELENTINEMKSEHYKFKDKCNQEHYGEDLASYILIYAVSDDESESLQLIDARSGLPRQVLKYFTDERVYITDEGDEVIAEDGVPMDVFYYYEGNEIKYSLEEKEGYKHVGT